MGPIHVARAGRSLGRFAPEDVAEGLRDGRFLPDDLAWCDPMPAWVRLSEFEGLPELEPAAPPPPPPPAQPAWERWREIGVLAAAAETVTSVLGKPREIFPVMPATGGLGGPLAFYVLLGTVSGWVALGYQYAVFRVNPEAFGEAFRQLPDGALEVVLVLSAILLPLTSACGVFLMSGLFHGVLKLLSPPPVRFETTFRVTCYAWGAAAILQLVPACGAMLFPVLAIYLTALGLRLTQNVPPSAALLATLLPVCICFGGILLLQAAMLAQG